MNLSMISDLIKPIGEVVDSLHTSKEEKLEAKQKIEELFVGAEQHAQKEVTSRWQADTNSDSWLPKNIRPLTLAFLTGVLVILSFFDGNIGQFSIKESYVSVYETLLMVVYSAYFVGRSMEKVRRITNGDK